MLETVPKPLVADLRKRHGEAPRHYHDWTHVEALLGHLATVRELVHDSSAVLYAILFHDAVYDPKAKDNERQSAALLLLAQLPLDPASLALAKRMIEATEGHFLPNDLAGFDRDDCALFLDMDLGILGADAERFDIYEAQIRREYAHVPDDAFRQARAAVLRHFSERETLYFSDWGRDRFEASARANIARSLAALGV